MPEKTTAKTLLGTAALVGLSFTLAACDDSEEDAAAQDGAEQQEPGEAPQPEVDDIPDVVAEVNGEEISGEDFTATYEQQFMQVSMQAQMTGEEIDQDELKQSTVDGMIGNLLLRQDAEDSGYEASEEDVEELLSDAAEQQGLESAEEFLEMAEEQGISEEQMREDAEAQVMVDQLLDSLDVEEPSEEELRERYDEQMGQQEQMQELQEAEGGEGAEGGEQELPEFEDVRDALEQQMTQEARSEAAVEHADSLRDEADIEIHL